MDMGGQHAVVLARESSAPGAIRGSISAMLRFARRPAVTLIELLTSFSILALLIALLVPGTGFARERIRRVVCANNLRQWGVAVLAYRHDNDDYLPMEGTYWKWDARGTWYNELPPYLGMPAYKDIEGANVQIKEAPKLSTWICPSKNLTRAHKSDSGKNQFDYAMNQVLDGLGTEPDGSADAPGFPDQKSVYTPAHLYDREPYTVFMFDIEENSMAGTPRKVANMYQRDYAGKRIGKFHGDFANVLYISGGVGHCVADDLVTDHDFEHGDVIWNAQHLYWGYPPPERR